MLNVMSQLCQHNWRRPISDNRTIYTTHSYLVFWEGVRNAKIQCGVDLYADNTIINRGLMPSRAASILAVLLILLSRNSLLQLFSIKITLT